MHSNLSRFFQTLEKLLDSSNLNINESMRNAIMPQLSPLALITSLGYKGGCLFIQMDLREIQIKSKTIDDERRKTLRQNSLAKMN